MDLKLLSAVGANALGAMRGATPATGGVAAAAAAKTGANFASALDSALKSVSQLQNDATGLQRQYQMGVDSVSLEDTMVSMQKAQVGFQAAMAVRNRLVSAYSDIMNMQV